MVSVISIVGAIILLASSVLITAAAMGKALTVSPSRELSGVEKSVQDALWYSSIAANSHNAQMWTVKLNNAENKIEIAIDAGRTLKVVDPKDRESYISLGCYIETLSFAFDAFGYDTVIAYKNEDGKFKATVEFDGRDDMKTKTENLDVIDKRHTDKSAYLSSKIAQEKTELLLSKFADIKQYNLGEEKFEFLKNGTLDAVTIQSQNADYREELSGWMRFSDKEASGKLDGITAEMIGLTGIVKSFYYWMTNAKSAKGDGFAKQGIDTAKKQVDNCGAFFVISGGDSMEELVDVGRKTQAFWFECTRLDIAIQPLSAMLETSPYAENIQNRLGLESSVQMILRAGSVKNYGKNSGLRRNLSDYIEVIS